MALKLMYEKESDIPEALKSAYVERDGKWHLDAEGMVAASEVTAINTKLSEFRQNNIDLTEKIKKFDGKTMLSTEEQEEFEALKKTAQDIEDKKLVDAGKIDELLVSRTEKMRKDFEARITVLTKTAEDAVVLATAQSGRLSKVMIRSEVSKLLSDQGITTIQGAMDDIYARAGTVWTVNDKGELSPDASGDVKYGADGEPLKLKEWGESLVKEAPYLFAENEGTGGKGKKGSDKPGSDGILRIPRSDQDMYNRNIEKISKGEAIVVDG